MTSGRQSSKFLPAYLAGSRHNELRAQGAWPPRVAECVPAAPQPLSPASSLAAAMQAYHAYLAGRSYSAHTVKAFVHDIALLARFLGLSQPIDGITTRDLERFLAYLKAVRGEPCSPKSLNRRVTALKSFFRWLAENDLIHRDPAAALAYKRALPPLPEVLFDDEYRRLLAEASKDSRSYLLVLLLLEAGLKREELLELKPADFDLSNPYQPELWVRAGGKRFKERRLRLPPEVPAVLTAYEAEYRPQERLFDCSERNLGYILKELAERAGVAKRVSCQTLRDTCAVRQLRVGAAIETVLEKLGLAPGSYNEETKQKYLRLARPGL